MSKKRSSPPGHEGREPREFYLVSGAGNDFIALIGEEPPPPPATVASLCHRGLSLGADGLFVLRRERAVVRVDHYNADGGEAELCVNGARCAVLLALELEWSGAPVRLATASGRVIGEPHASGIRLTELPRPSTPHRRRLPLPSGVVEGWSVTVGGPHFVLFFDSDLREVPVAELGPPLRRHRELGPAGANVSFARVLSSSRLEVRTWERGVEGETLACGSGALATVAAGLAAGSLSLPVGVLTAGGFELVVDDASSGAELELSLAGDARIIARGRLGQRAAEHPGGAVFRP